MRKREGKQKQIILNRSVAISGLRGADTIEVFVLYVAITCFIMASSWKANKYSSYNNKQFTYELNSTKLNNKSYL